MGDARVRGWPAGRPDTLTQDVRGSGGDEIRDPSWKVCKLTYHDVNYSELVYLRKTVSFSGINIGEIAKR